MQDASGGVFIGKVWPGFTAYPDFLNPKAIQYWQNVVSGLIWVLSGGRKPHHPLRGQADGSKRGGGGGGRGERGREGEREREELGDGSIDLANQLNVQ